MFRGENIIGILLLLFCGVAAIILVVAIITGNPPSVPEGLCTPLTVIGFVAIVIMLWQRFSGRFRRK